MPQLLAPLRGRIITSSPGWNHANLQIPDKTFGYSTVINYQHTEHISRALGWECGLGGELASRRRHSREMSRELDVTHVTEMRDRNGSAG
jgi:hypothetical protein